MDFTCAAYDRLLASALDAGYRVLRVRDALTGPPASPALIIRHDVEWNIRRTLAVINVEQQRGIRSSLYFRVDTRVYDPAQMCRLQDAGFEIGYHFNTLDRCRGDFARAARTFENELFRLREAGLDVTTAIPHGDPRIRRIGYRSNADILSRDPGFLARLKLLDVGGGLAAHFPEFVYIADLGISWNGVRSAAELLAGIQLGRWPAIYLLTHPDYWSASWFRAVGMQIAACAMRGLNINRIIAGFRRSGAEFRTGGAE